MFTSNIYSPLLHGLRVEVRDHHLPPSGRRACQARPWGNSLMNLYQIMAHPHSVFWRDVLLPNGVVQCFSTFFASRHPWSAISIFGGTPRWQNRTKDQWIAIIGGTLGTISWYPSVPRHPSWEPLFYCLAGWMWNT